MDEKNIREITRFLKAGKPLPISYKDILFPPDKKPKEYELVYDNKEREEDILADTMAVPLQKVKTFGNNGEGGWTNKLIFGDNLQALKSLLKDPEVSGKVKCVYIDPPFATKKEFQGSKEQRAYQDKIEGAKFIEFIRKRLVLIRELLSPDGSVYVHLDTKKVHYLKVIMDGIFGENKFKNEIIWQRADPHNDPIKQYGKIHDTILFYSGPNSKFNWDKITKPLSKAALKEYCWTELPDGTMKKFDKNLPLEKQAPLGSKRLKLNDATQKGNNPKRQFEWRGVKLKANKQWLGTLEEMEEKLKKGELYLPKYPKGAKRCKKGYLDEREQVGQVIQDIWQDAGRMKGGKGVYPTQKPEKILERVILASSDPGDIVLDCFAGSGTTLAVAEKLGRRWIGVDSSKFATYTIQKRMLNLKEKIGDTGKKLKPRPFTLHNAGLYDYDLVSQLGQEEYKKFALDLFQVEHHPLKIGGFHFEGTLYNCPAHVYLGKGKLTREYVYSLHKFVDGKKDRVFIIAPAGKVVPLEDYIQCDNTKYYFLRIPYSIIDEIHKTSFVRLIQPASVDDINDPLESTGFDFIIPPEVECDFYKIKNSETLVDEFVINLKRFEPIQISKKPIEFKDMEALSMVFVDRNYNGTFFNLTDYYFRDEIEKNNFKMKFSDENVGERIMIIYLDILGNEKKEVKRRPDFKKRAPKKKK